MRTAGRVDAVADREQPLGVAPDEEIRDRLIDDGLDLSDLAPDPMDNVRAWMEMATAVDVHEPAAMTLATVDDTGTPDARTVLLRGVDTGFCWYTDRESTKGGQLAAVPSAAIVLAWTPLGRQIRAVGSVEETTPSEDDAYWATRLRESQIAAVSSRQSAVLTDRAELDAAFAAVERAHSDGDVPRPSRWGGYRLTAERVEFWQQRPHRRHDRIRYERVPSGWIRSRLSP